MRFLALFLRRAAVPARATSLEAAPLRVLGVLVLALWGALSLASCGNTPSTAENTSNTSDTPSATTDNTTGSSGTGSGTTSHSNSTSSTATTSTSPTTTNGTSAVGTSSSSTSTSSEPGSTASSGATSTAASSSAEANSSTSNTTSSTTSSGNQTSANDELSWVPSWGTTIQSLEASKPDHVPPTLAGNTLRQFIWPTLSGAQVRIKISNVKGAQALDIQKVHIAKAMTESDPGTSGGAIDVTTDAAFTFDGMPNVTIPAGMTVWSDGIDFPLEEVTLTAISIQFGQSIPSNISNHPGSRTTSYFGNGDAVSTATLSGETRDRWYFIELLDVMAPADAGAIACLGDSITDGYGILNKFARWTDALTLAIKNDPMIASKRSVINLGMGANTIVTPGVAEQDTGMVRFENEVLTNDRIKWLIVLEGVNDLTGGAQAATITDAYADLVEQARAKGIKVWVSPLTPMNEQNNTQRDAINQTVRAADYYDPGIDFDMAIRDAGNPTNTQAAFKNDDLHPNEAGYKAMGDSVDLSLFY